jgi:hypothetical protein
MIKLARKTLKTDDKQETCKQWLGNLDMPVQTSSCHQTPYHPHRDHGGIHIMVEWGNFSKNGWIITQSTPPLQISISYCDKGG